MYESIKTFEGNFNLTKVFESNLNWTEVFESNFNCTKVFEGRVAETFKLSNGCLAEHCKLKWYIKWYKFWFNLINFEIFAKM